MKQTRTPHAHMTWSHRPSGRVENTLGDACLVNNYCLSQSSTTKKGNSSKQKPKLRDGTTESKAVIPCPETLWRVKSRSAPHRHVAIQWKVFNPGMFSLQILQKGLLHNFRTELSIMGLGFYFRFIFDVLESDHLLSPLRKQYLRISEWTIREVNSNLIPIIAINP